MLVVGHAKNIPETGGVEEDMGGDDNVLLLGTWRNLFHLA